MSSPVPNSEFENLSLDADGYKSSWKDRYADRKVSPRMRIAAKLYQSGIAKTLGEAAKLAGLAPSSLYAMNISENDEFNRISNKAAVDREIATGDISVVLQRLGRSALTKLNSLMETSGSEGIQLKAAQDLADRSPETSKVQKLAISSISLDGQDIGKITAAMVEAAEVKMKFVEVTTGDFVRVSTDAPAISELTALPAPIRDNPPSEEPSNG